MTLFYSLYKCPLYNANKINNITQIVFLDTLIMCTWVAQKYQLVVKCITKYNYQYQINRCCF